MIPIPQWLFGSTFSRAETYGMLLFVWAISIGANKIVALLIFLAWSAFAAGASLANADGSVRESAGRKASPNPTPGASHGR